MADPPSYPDTGDDTGVRSDGESPTSIRRWVKVVGIIVAILVLLVVVKLLIGGGPGGHGPGRHGLAGEPAEQIEQDAPGDHGSPEGGHQ